MGGCGRSNSWPLAGKLLLLALAVVQPAAEVAAQSSDPSFYVVNRSSLTIRYIYVSPVDTNQWGRDWLGKDVLAPGNRFRIAPTRDGRCIYDVRVVYTNEQTEDRRRQDLCAISELAFSGPASTAASGIADFDVVNNSSQTIINVYVSAQTSDKWGEDRLPGTIAPGSRFKVKLPRGECHYDVRIVYADKSSDVRRRQNLCATTDMVFTGASSIGAGTVPAGGASNADFDVVNRSSQTIINVYVSPQQLDKWGEDRLPGTIAPGAKFSVKLPRDGQCQYDVRVVYADKTTEDRRRQNLCATTEMVFSGSGSR